MVVFQMKHSHLDKTPHGDFSIFSKSTYSHLYIGILFPKVSGLEEVGSSSQDSIESIERFPDKIFIKIDSWINKNL